MVENQKDKTGGPVSAKDVEGGAIEGPVSTRRRFGARAALGAAVLLTVGNRAAWGRFGEFSGGEKAVRAAKVSRDRSTRKRVFRSVPGTPTPRVTLPTGRAARRASSPRRSKLSRISAARAATPCIARMKASSATRNTVPCGKSANRSRLPGIGGADHRFGRVA